MAGATAMLLGAEQGLEAEILIKAGGAAGVFALVAMLLVVPLFLAQRREIRRLMRWQDLEPHRGDEGSELDAVAMGAAAVPATGTHRPGELPPAARVTSERPALDRITAERAAMDSPSFWRRLITRGPRHPLVISALAVLLAVGAVAVVALSGDVKDPESASGSQLDRADVSLVVLNGSSQAALAGKVADSLSAAGFEQVRTGVTGNSKQTVVLFEKGNKRAANALKRELGAVVIQPMDRVTRAAAPGADVVVVAGEDRARA